MKKLLTEAAEEDLGVAQGGQDVVEGDLALRGIPALVCLEAGFDVGAFWLVQPRRLFGARSRISEKGDRRASPEGHTHKVGNTKRKPMQMKKVREPSRIKIQRHPP